MFVIGVIIVISFESKKLKFNNFQSELNTLYLTLLVIEFSFFEFTINNIKESV